MKTEQRRLQIKNNLNNIFFTISMKMNKKNSKVIKYFLLEIVNKVLNARKVVLKVGYNYRWKTQWGQDELMKGNQVYRLRVYVMPYFACVLISQPIYIF